MVESRNPSLGESMAVRREFLDEQSYFGKAAYSSTRSLHRDILEEGRPAVGGTKRWLVIVLGPRGNWLSHWKRPVVVLMNQAYVYCIGTERWLVVALEISVLGCQLDTLFSTIASDNEKNPRPRGYRAGAGSPIILANNGDLRLHSATSSKISGWVSFFTNNERVYDDNLVKG